MREGFWVLDEAFLDMPSYALHPQSLLMETTWVCSWCVILYFSVLHQAIFNATTTPRFERLLKCNEDLKSQGDQNQVFIADRSPFSAVFYGNKGEFFLKGVTFILSVLRTSSGAHN